MSAGEHLSPAYKAINPTSTIPALVDGDNIIFDSSAISIYLVEKYAKNDSLYPKDLMLRTKVNERLFFIASFMFPRGTQMLYPICFGKATEIDETKLKEMMRGYETLDTFLTGNDYLTGSTMTLCDISGWSLMEASDRFLPVDEEKFPNLKRWLTKMREHPEYPLVKEGADMHMGFIKKCLERNIAAATKATAKP